MTSQCIRSVFASAILFLAVATPHAAAQADTVPPDVLSSVNTESSWATGLYVASVVEAVAAAPLLISGALLSSACWIGGSSSNCDPFTALLDIGLILGAAFLVTLPIAIALDVDATSRRHVAGSASIVPMPMGLGLAGTF